MLFGEFAPCGKGKISEYENMLFRLDAAFQACTRRYFNILQYFFMI